MLAIRGSATSTIVHGVNRADHIHHQRLRAAERGQDIDVLHEIGAADEIPALR